MQAEEIREMAEDEIVNRIAELQEERFRLRFRSATETLEDPLRFRGSRKVIARPKPILRDWQQAQQAPASASGAR